MNWNYESIGKLVIGILIFSFSIFTLISKHSSFFWIGGMVLGSAIMAESFKEITTSIVICENCRQKVRIPNDKRKFNAICPQCKKPPIIYG